MKRTIFTAVAVLVGAAAGSMLWAQRSAPKDGERREAACPMRVEGAKVHVVEIDSGVVIHVTAKDEEAVKRIRAAAGLAAKAGAEPAAGAGHACPMHDGTSAAPKAGGCSKCGTRKE